jgi:hypothetical protein
MSDESFAEFERMAEALATLGDVICWPPLIAEARRAREAEAALRAERDRYRKALEEIAAYKDVRGTGPHLMFQTIAAAALASSTDAPAKLEEKP